MPWRETRFGQGIPWFRRLEGRVTLFVSGVALVSLGLTGAAAGHLLSRYAEQEDQEKIFEAHRGFRRLVLDRADHAQARIELITSLPVFRAHMTDPKIQGDVATLGAMVSEFRGQLGAAFCLVANRQGSWMAVSNWPAGASKSELEMMVTAAMGGETNRRVVGIRDGGTHTLYLVLAQPARFGDEVLGVLVVGYRLGDGFATELSSIAGVEICLLHSERITGSSLLERQKQELQQVIERRKLEIPSISRLELTSGSFAVAASLLSLPTLPADGAGLVLLRDRGPTDRLREEVLAALLSLGVITFGLALIMARLYSRHLALPLWELATAAEQIASGDIEKRVTPSGSPETLALASSFNEMTNHLQAANRELIQKSDQLQSALEQSQSAFEQFRTAEEALKASEDQLRQAQKMDAIGRLAGGVAHDFNNMLAVINGYAELVLVRLPEQDPSRPRVQEILKAGQRAAGLTAQLLAFGRKSVVAPQLLDLSELVERSSQMLKRLIGEDVDLVMLPADRPVRVQADPIQLEQIVLNLALNGRDAMPEGGKLTVEVSIAELDAAYAATHPTARPGRYALLSVTDTGVGMDAETISHVFEPFFTTKSSGKGTGLGLSTVYGITQQCGGHVHVYSELNIGSCFKVYLPLADVGQRVQRPERAMAAEQVGGVETLLVVEDEEPVRELVREALSALGYEVLLAGDPEAALAVARDHAGEIALLLTDVVMPGCSGRELAARVRAQRPGVRVLYMSGYTDDAVVRHGILNRDAGFLEKPFTMERLAQVVRKALSGEASESAEPPPAASRR